MIDDGSKRFQELWAMGPSVTRVLRHTMSDEKKASLQAWRERIGDEKADEVLKNSQERGNKFDQAVGDLIDDGVIHPDYEHILPKIFDGYEVWGYQTRFANPLYHGIVDCFGNYYNSVDMVIDIKTWGRYMKREWLEDYFCQIAAYATEFGVPRAQIIGTDGRKIQYFTLKAFEVREYYQKFLLRLQQFKEMFPNFTNHEESNTEKEESDIR